MSAPAGPRLVAETPQPECLPAPAPALAPALSPVLAPDDRRLSAASEPRATAAQLMRRLLSRPEHRMRLRDPRVVPIGGDQVLKTVAGLVAASDDGAAFRFEPRFHPGGLAGAVALRRGWVGGEDQVKAFLDALARAELITLGEHCVSLPLPALPEPVPEAADGLRPFKNSPGTRKPGMTDDQWVDYRRSYREGFLAQKAGDRAAMRAVWDRLDALLSRQRSMMLPIPGTGERAAVAGAGDISKRISAVTDIQSHIQDDMPVDIEAAAGRYIGGISGSDIASRTDDDDSDQDRYLSESESSSSVAARAGEAISGVNISGEDIPGADISEAGRAEIESWLGEISRRCGLRVTPGDRRTVEGWWRDGAVWPDVAETVDEREARYPRERLDDRSRIRTARYFSDRVATNRATRLSKQTPPPVGAPPPGQNGPPAAAWERQPLEPDPDCPPDLAPLWQDVRLTLQRDLGHAEWRAWLRTMRLVGVQDEEVTVSFGTAFLASHATKHYGEPIFRAWHLHGASGSPASHGVRRVRVVAA